MWLADDYLLRHGYTITTRPDGRRTATCDGLTYLLGPVCGHGPDVCPPHRATHPKPTTRAA
ncbi:hypothetical protein [Polymorphospora lycopeni]|uniref:Uncharacterized protein n=1 Tax=Polymorphospora lycopeni TaxID=3140240 RepID=A0ABV5CKT9_9ACTN